MTTRDPTASSLTFTAPCLAAPVPMPPDGDTLLHEIKYDGYRVQALFENGAARLLTRSGLDWTERFGLLPRELSALPVTSIAIDGEAVVLDGNGISRFGLLQTELGAGAIARVTMMAFDILHLDGRNLAPLPLIERKAILADVLTLDPKSHSLLRYVDHMSGHGPNVLTKACTMGLEGVVSKRVDRPYRSGRHGDWTKSKCVRSDPFVVVGYTTQTGATAIVGALVLGYYDGERLVYAGRVGTGFSVGDARAIAGGLETIHSAPPEFTHKLDRAQRSGVRWVTPKLVAQIAWRDVTPDGLLRHATFEHFRTDKDASEIRRPAAFL